MLLKKNVLMKDINSIFTSLDYDYTIFTLPDFTDHAAGFVRKEILLIPYALEKTLSGIWVHEQTAHYVFYNNQLHIILQIHTILHEIAHIVLEHKPKPVDHYLNDDILNEYNITHPVGRARINPSGNASDDQELEAEEFVFLIQHQLMLLNRSSELFGDNLIPTGLRQFTKILE
jgi:hypothetical protein